MQPADPPEAADPASAGNWEQLALGFVAEMRGSLSTERLQEFIVERLPILLGVEQVWIYLQLGDRRKLIAPTVVDDTPPADPLFAMPGEWATFPLKTGDESIGFILIPIAERPLPAAATTTAVTLAPIIADSLRTASLIAQLRESSTVDPVTGCMTRQEGLDRLRAELKRAQRSAEQVAVLMLDLDFFKSINDRYGHQCGDSVLSAIGETIMQTLRGSDIRCRWGGEEFLIALPESGVEPAKRVAMTLARRIATTVTEYDSARIQLTASIGVTIAMPGDDDADSVVARADAALYRAKADGRNCVRIMLQDGGAKGPQRADTTTPPVATATTLPLRDRRDPTRADRRAHPGPGRRVSDRLFDRRSASGPDTADEVPARATPA